MTTYMSKETLPNRLDTIIGLLSCINDNLCEMNEFNHKRSREIDREANERRYHLHKMLKTDLSYYENQGDD